MDAVKQLFSPATLAALRYALVAIAPLLGVVGIVALSPQQIDKIIALAQQLGTAVAAIAAFIGIVTPLVAGAIGTFKATKAQQVKTVSEISLDPTSSANEPAKQALLAATIALPEVQTIVADKKLADAAPSDSVVPSDKVKVINNASGDDINK